MKPIEPMSPLERFLLKLVGIPLAIAGVFVLVHCSQDLQSAARACAEQCRAEGASRHVFVPGNALKGLERRCTCVEGNASDRIAGG